MRKILLIIILFILSNISTHADEMELCKVIRIIDGDTIEVIYRGEKEKVRLYGIDCPERGEEGYNKATAFVKELILNQEVSILFPSVKKRDNFGRLLADIYLSDHSLLNKTILDFNHAKVYVKQKAKDVPAVKSPEQKKDKDFIDQLAVAGMYLLNNKFNTIEVRKIKLYITYEIVHSHLFNIPEISLKPSTHGSLDYILCFFTVIKQCKNHGFNEDKYYLFPSMPQQSFTKLSFAKYNNSKLTGIISSHGEYINLHNIKYCSLKDYLNNLPNTLDTRETCKQIITQKFRNKSKD